MGYSSMFQPKSYLSKDAIMHCVIANGLMFQDMKSTLAQELDFENEARNGERCIVDLMHFPYVYVPKIYWDFTSKV